MACGGRWWCNTGIIIKNWFTLLRARNAKWFFYSTRLKFIAFLWSSRGTYVPSAVANTARVSGVPHNSQATTTATQNDVGGGGSILLFVLRAMRSGSIRQTLYRKSDLVGAAPEIKENTNYNDNSYNWFRCDILLGPLSYHYQRMDWSFQSSQSV